MYCAIMFIDYTLFKNSWLDLGDQVRELINYGIVHLATPFNIMETVDAPHPYANHPSPCIKYIVSEGR